MVGWSLDEKIAMRDARRIAKERHGAEPRLRRGFVARRNVLALFEHRGRIELVVDPANILKMKMKSLGTPKSPWTTPRPLSNSVNKAPSTVDIGRLAEIATSKRPTFRPNNAGKKRRVLSWSVDAGVKGETSADAEPVSTSVIDPGGTLEVLLESSRSSGVNSFRRSPQRGKRPK